MSTTSQKTNSVPKVKKPFPYSSDKTEMVDLYCPDGLGKTKTLDMIKRIMVATSGDPYADGHKLINNKQVRAIVQYLGVPKNYTIADIPFMTESDL